MVSNQLSTIVSLVLILYIYLERNRASLPVGFPSKVGVVVPLLFVLSLLLCGVCADRRGVSDGV